MSNERVKVLLGYIYITLKISIQLSLISEMRLKNMLL